MRMLVPPGSVTDVARRTAGTQGTPSDASRDQNAEVHVVPISDPDDERLADYLRLTDGELRRQGEVFLCEGVLSVRRAVEVGARFASVLVTTERLEHVRADIAGVDAPVYVVDQSLLNQVTGFNLHRGLIAAVHRPAPRPLGELLTGPTIAVLEGLNDHENLGVLFRNAAAFGIDAVLLDERAADPLYRRCVRVSLGHVLGVPHGRFEDLEQIEAAGYELVALTPHRTAEPVEVITGLPKVALLLGAEGPGLTDATLARAHRRVRIPMVDGVDSLNVATAAAIAFHHRFRGG
jgi:tRNA G18 (ribose-2'-O)-methylase SpoU